MVGTLWGGGIGQSAFLLVNDGMTQLFDDHCMTSAFVLLSRGHDSQYLEEPSVRSRRRVWCFGIVEWVITREGTAPQQWRGSSGRGELLRSIGAVEVRREWGVAVAKPGAGSWEGA